MLVTRVTKSSAQQLWASCLMMALALFLVSALFICTTMQRGITLYDEGLILVGAERVGSGAIIHRDFYANYGPAQFYCIAWLFKWLSPSVLVERAWDTVVRSATTVVCFALILRLASFQRAIFGYLFALIWLGSLGFPGYPLFPTLLFALLSTYCLVLLYQGVAEAPATVGAGLAAGIATLFRYDLGFLVVAAESVVAPAYLWLRPAVPFCKRGRSAVRLGLLYAAGLAIPTLPVAVWYASTSALGDFFFDIVYFPMDFYARTRSLPFPPLNTLRLSTVREFAVYLPIVIWVVAAISLFWRDAPMQAAETRDTRWAVGQLLVLAPALYVKGLVRVSPIHMAPSIILSVILLFVTATPRDHAGRLARGSVAVAFILTAICTVVPLRGALSQLAENVRWVSGPGRRSCEAPPGLNRIRCFEIGAERTDAARYVQQLTKSDDYIFVGAGRHDKIFLNDIAFYFVAERLPATKWYQFDPGLQTSASIQSDIIAELKDKRPPVIVLETQWDSVMEPNDSALSSHVVLLDNFISQAYRVVKTFGSIRILKRIAN
jgi:hypothetical protein